MNIVIPIQDRLSKLNVGKLPAAVVKEIAEEVRKDVQAYATKRCGQISGADVVKALKNVMAPPQKPEAAT